MASDGLWDVLDFPKVAALAAAADREHDGSVVAVAHAAVAAAKAAHTRDDITVLVVRVWPEADWEVLSPTRGVHTEGGAGSFERQAAAW